MARMQLYIDNVVPYLLPLRHQESQQGVGQLSQNRTFVPHSQRVTCSSCLILICSQVVRYQQYLSLDSERIQIRWKCSG